MSDFAKNITVIIPTMNRSGFLIKMFRIFRETGFGGTVLIGDSSNDTHFSRTKEAIETENFGFPITQVPFPGKKNFECIWALCEHLSTPYTIWMADDDILVPRTLDKCAQFLDRHPDYSGVGGTGVMLTLTGEDFETAVAAAPYSIPALEQDSAIDRIRDLGSNYRVVSHYSLCRTEQFPAKFRPFADLTDLSITCELLPTFLQTVQGKIAMLDQLFVVRQNHDSRYLLPDVYDWFTLPDWPSSLSAMHRILVEAVIENDGISEEEASHAVKGVLWNYLNISSQNHYNWKYGENQSSALKERLRAVPFVRTLYRALQNSFGNHANRISLPGLLRKSSPLYEDFFPIYRVLTRPVDG